MIKSVFDAKRPIFRYSTGDFQPALAALFGEDAAGLPAINIARVTAGWAAGYRQFRKRSLAERDYVRVWANGIHFNVRLGQPTLYAPAD